MESFEISSSAPFGILDAEFTTEYKNLLFLLAAASNTPCKYNNQ